MEYRRLGRSGLKVSTLSLGTMTFGNPTSKDEALRIIESVLDSGISLVDCVDACAGGEGERIVGEALETRSFPCASTMTLVSCWSSLRPYCQRWMSG